MTWILSEFVCHFDSKVNVSSVLDKVNTPFCAVLKKIVNSICIYYANLI